ncbi:hypothetical protein SpCBS45565_g00299 [Spizellomyces sp. 'palustris']|nr:hypothetical protein SpCBS45565_g00299 [Spizellomyces sp. 'palustris']
MPPIHITSHAEFTKHISASTLASFTTVIDFYATWCGPCKAIAPRYESLATKYPSVTFLKVDVDEHQDITRECSVSAMPTFHLYRSGNRLGEVVGADINRVEHLVHEYSSGGSSEGVFPGKGRKLTGEVVQEETSRRWVWVIVLMVLGWVLWRR